MTSVVVKGSVIASGMLVVVAEACLQLLLLLLL
jgi:hypothetical protein